MSYFRKSTAAVGRQLVASPFDARNWTTLVAWYDARYVNGLTGAAPNADAALSIWYDLSGNGYHLEQSSGTAQPLYRAANGTYGPRIEFDGSNDGMRTTMNLALAAHVPVTIYAAWKTDDNTNTKMFVELSNDMNINAGWFLTTGINGTFAARGDSAGVSYNNNAGAGWAGSVPLVSSVTMDTNYGANYMLRKNSVAQSVTVSGTPSNPGTPTTTKPLNVGGRNAGAIMPFDGFLYALAIYDGIHSTGTRAEIEAQMMSAFNIT